MTNVREIVAVPCVVDVKSEPNYGVLSRFVGPYGDKYRSGIGAPSDTSGFIGNSAADTPAGLREDLLA